MKKLVLMGLAASLGVAQAQLWTEVGDAGDLPGTAQITVGSGALDFIGGFIGNNPAADGNDKDMYCIYIADPSLFSATTVGGSSLDTQLFLFNTGGFGVTFNDDHPGGGVLQSTIAGTFLPGPGHYYLAISRYDRDPVDATGAELWLDTPYDVERAPDGPGAGSPIFDWNSAHRFDASLAHIGSRSPEHPTARFLSPRPWPPSGLALPLWFDDARNKLLDR